MPSPVVFRVAVAALFAALTIPRMTQRGMFGDGLVYATIARNLSIGSGSLWAPQYTETAWSGFYEHPPLGLALQAAAFWLLGDHLIVERVFSLIIFGLHALVIATIWRRLEPAALDWLPLLFWLVPSIVTWGVVNNMLENTQALFTSTAILLLIDAVRAPAGVATVTRSAAAGVAIVAAVLTKGPVGLFPLAAPLLFRLFGLMPAADGGIIRAPSSRRAWLFMTVTVFAVVAMSAAALAAYPPSSHNMTMYVRTHLAPAMLGLRDVSDPLAVVRHLAMGIVGRMTVLLALCWWMGRRAERAAAPSEAFDGALCFLALGFCAAAPIAISPKVSGHYFLPAVPMFALGFASIARGFVASRAPKPILIAACAIVAAVTLFFALGRAGTRDAALLRDLDAIDRAMPREMTIGACRHPRASRDWGLHTYVQRWYRVSLDARDMPINGWLLRADAACDAPPACVPVAQGRALTLFRCPEPHQRTSH
jgi:4-amino-4-deoxy-L-arabinose transferase-like glycosyltransferase